MSFRVHTETKQHFLATGNAGDFRIAKAGLHPTRVAQFRKMAEGGTVDPMKDLLAGPDTTDAESKQAMQTQKKYKIAKPGDPGVQTVELEEKPVKPKPKSREQLGIDLRQGMADGGLVDESNITGKEVAEKANTIGKAVANMIPAPDPRTLLGGPLSKGVAAVRSVLPGGSDYETEKAHYNEAYAEQRPSITEPLTGYGPAAGLKITRDVLEKNVGTIPWHEMDLGEAQKAARSQIHLRRDSTGQYIGAPRGIDTPEKLQAMRTAVDKAVKTGGFGADWYEHAKDSITTLTGGDPVQAEQFSKLMAIYSPQATQEGNMSFAASAWNRNALEGPSGVAAKRVRKGVEAKSSAAMFRDPESMAGLGPKTEPYWRGLDPRQANESMVRGVNDLWVGRSYGYVQPGSEAKSYSPSEHSFMTAENLLAADRAHKKGIIPKDLPGVMPVQASMWVGDRLAWAKKNHPDWPEEMQKAWANNSPQEVMMKGRNFAKEMVEATPGAATGHLPNIAKNPELNEAFNADPRNSFLDPQNRDMMYKAAGMLQKPAERGQGVYTGAAGTEHNPNLKIQPMVGYAPNQAATNPSADPNFLKKLGGPSKAMMDQINQLRTLVQGQEAGYWEAPGQATAKSPISNFRKLPWGEPGSGTATKAVMEGGRGPGSPATAEFPASPPGKFFPMDPRLKEKLDASPDLRKRYGEIADAAQEWSTKGGGPVREDLVRLNRILERQGLNGLSAHVAKYGYGGLPATAIASLEMLRRSQGGYED